MCIPMPAQVISMEGATALVRCGGRPVQVACPTRPNLQPGDWVLVYLGQVVDRLQPEEASALQELLAEAALATRQSRQGLSTSTPHLNRSSLA